MKYTSYFYHCELSSATKQSCKARACNLMRDKLQQTREPNTMRPDTSHVALPASFSGMTATQINNTPETHARTPEAQAMAAEPYFAEDKMK